MWHAVVAFRYNIFKLAHTTSTLITRISILARLTTSITLPASLSLFLPEVPLSALHTDAIAVLLIPFLALETALAVNAPVAIS